MPAKKISVSNSGGFKLSRRRYLKVLAGGIVGATIGPAIVGKAQTKGKVFISTTGGSAEEGFRRAWYDPFTKETGIEVVPTVITSAKVIAMVRSGNVAIDITSNSPAELERLVAKGALEKLDNSKFKLTKLEDIDRVTDYWISKNVYATVIGYNTQVFKDRHPESWAEFWDVRKFPGPRMLQHASNEYPNLEQALLADGVPMDKLYPIDLERAFAKLREIRPHIVKWWESGAVAAQMLSDRVVVLGSVWESRITPLIVVGAPLAIEWNQAMRNPFGIGIVTNAPNRENAYLLLDYGQQPKVQAVIAREVKASPANQRAYQYLDESLAKMLASYPAHAKKGFVNNSDWWVKNLDKVLERWREFMLEK